MNKRSYKAFTLIEMLIVMGILIILMAVGVAAGRFAIDRANEISHKNGATQLYQALQAYYTDNLKFPTKAEGSKFETLLDKDNGVLFKYLDMGSFKGGSDATYTYFVDTEHQSTVVCVTLGGTGDSGDKGIVCVGNGFGKAINCGTQSLAGIGNEKLESKDSPDTEYVAVRDASECASDWNSKTKKFGTTLGLD